MVKINKHAKPASQLPEGWMVLTKYRKRGSSKGHRDLTYYSPDMQRFRSLVAAKRFIAANTAPEADSSSSSEDNLIVEQKNDVNNIIAVVLAASSADALADSSNSNDVIVIDSSSEDESDDESLWM